MADIRDRESEKLVGSGAGAAHSPLARARASSSDRMSDKIVAEIGREQVEKNIAANAARKWGVMIFGRLHVQQWDDKDLAQETADKIGGEVVEVN
jgi:hypothetical protein